MLNIVKPAEMSDKEAQEYIKHLEKENPNRKLEKVTISIDENDPGYVTLSYQLEPVSFERIRRITGYLVGTMDRWNNAKRAEEHDRVKHGV